MNAAPTIQRWDGSPLHVLRRIFESSKDISPENRAHILLVTDRIMARIPNLDDIGLQMAGRSVCATYATLIETQTKALRATPGTKRHETLWLQTMRLQDHLNKLLRGLGLRAIPAGTNGKGAKGTGCSPPRPAAPSELRAAMVSPPEPPPEGESPDTP